MKINCWEYKKCERRPDGIQANEFGICPATTSRSHHGTNGGINAGRYCWRVAGTLCGGKTQGTLAKRIMDCAKCDFYTLVKEEEGNNFII